MINFLVALVALLNANFNNWDTDAVTVDLACYLHLCSDLSANKEDQGMVPHLMMNDFY